MSTNSVVYWGTGRRKTSVARVRLVPGNGTITINGRPGDNYLNYNPSYIAAVKACLLYTSPSPRDKRQSRMPSSA